MSPFLYLIVPLVLIGLLIRIGLRDLEVQKIANNDVLALLLLGLANTGLFLLQPDLVQDAWIAPVTGVALFAILFPFWMLKRIGAGDVKLIAVIPLAVGTHYLAEFGILFLLFVIINVVVLKGTVLDGISQIKRYIEFFGGRGIIPFGVPMSAAACIVLAMQVVDLMQVIPPLYQII